MVKEMCRQDVALEMLKSQPRKGGLTAGQIKLAEAQAADYKTQKGEIKMLGERMTNLEKKMSALEEEQTRRFDNIEKQMSELKKLIIEHNNRTLYDKILALKDHKYFWLTTIITILVLAALFGVPVSGFHGILNIGG